MGMASPFVKTGLPNAFGVGACDQLRVQLAPCIFSSVD